MTKDDIELRLVDLRATLASSDSTTDQKLAALLEMLQLEGVI